MRFLVAIPGSFLLLMLLHHQTLAFSRCLLVSRHKRCALLRLGQSSTTSNNSNNNSASDNTMDAFEQALKGVPPKKNGAFSSPSERTSSNSSSRASTILSVQPDAIQPKKNGSSVVGKEEETLPLNFNADNDASSENKPLVVPPAVMNEPAEAVFASKQEEEPPAVLSDNNIMSNKESSTPRTTTVTAVPTDFAYMSDDNGGISDIISETQKQQAQLVVSGDDDNEDAPATAELLTDNNNKWGDFSDRYTTLQNLATAQSWLVGSVAGAAAALPWLALHHFVLHFDSSVYTARAQLEYDLVASLVQGAVFAAVYRYAMRNDWKDLRLHNAVTGAFVLVRSLVRVDVPYQCATPDLICGPPFGPFDGEMVGQLAINTVESLFLFGAASHAMKWALEQRRIRAFLDDDGNE